MKVLLNSSFSSTSAALDKAISFLISVYDFKAAEAKSIYSSLTSLSKEKALDTKNIDAFLRLAKTAKADIIEKAKKSKSLLALKPVLVSLSKDKTFNGVLKTVKLFKFKFESSTKTKQDTGFSIEVKKAIESLNGAIKITDAISALSYINNNINPDGDKKTSVFCKKLSKAALEFTGKLGLARAVVKLEHGNRKLEKVTLSGAGLEVYIRPSRTGATVTLQKEGYSDDVIQSEIKTVTDLAAAISNAKIAIRVAAVMNRFKSKGL